MEGPAEIDVELRLLEAGDIEILSRVDPDVFDGPIERRWAHAFLDDPRHHMIVAVNAGLVVGMISAVDFVHPDKAPQLLINEVGVAGRLQKRGIGRSLVDAMLRHARAIGCTYAWLGTEENNKAARALYESMGSAAEPFVLYDWDLGSDQDPEK